MATQSSPAGDAAAGAGPRAPRLLLVSPNVSRIMGGEAIKALHILEGYRALGIEVKQVTHARVRDEMTAHRPELDFVYVEDGPVQKWLFKLRLHWFLGLVGSWILNRAARRLSASWQPDLVHFTSPISPTYPHFRLPGVPVVIGPLNGNLPHPPVLSHRESRGKKVGAKLLRIAQLANRLFFRGKSDARLFISGAERTVEALELGGCRRAQMVHTLDSGVSDEVCDQPRAVHAGENWTFVFIGRLVRYKACDLVIRALALAPQARLDIIGDGEERGALQALAAQLGVADRVTFSGYTTDREALFRRLRTYRAFVFPTLAEANGIVIQEAMMLGLPVVSVNWGGPAQLLDNGMAILLEPAPEALLVTQLAEAMSSLALDPARAERLSVAARAQAEGQGFGWPSLLAHWLALYDAFLAERGKAAVFEPWTKTRGGASAR